MANDDDDVLIRKTANPVTNTLLIVSTLALGTSIWIATQELGYYVNPKARGELKEYQISPVKLATDRFGNQLGKLLDKSERDDPAVRDRFILREPGLEKYFSGEGGAVDETPAPAPAEPAPAEAAPAPAEPAPAPASDEPSPE